MSVVTAPPADEPPNVTVKVKQHNIIVRAIYFLLVGWWFGLIVAFFGWFLYATVIGAPLGIKVLNAVPGSISLHAREKDVKVFRDEDGYTVKQVRKEQRKWWVRVLWYPFGLVLSFFAILLAWLLCVFLVTMPLGVMLFNKIPAIASLYRS
jgi:uncharacterized membrane protein YccF (DUF307 family)